MSDRRNDSSTTRSRRPETDPSDDSEPARVRAEYEEYTVGESTVVMITDPLNEHAWIHATEPVPVER